MPQYMRQGFGKMLIDFSMYIFNNSSLSLIPEWYFSLFADCNETQIGVLTVLRSV